MVWPSFGQAFIIALFAGHLKTDLSFPMAGSAASMLAMAIYCFLAALWLGALMTRLNRLAAA